MKVNGFSYEHENIKKYCYFGLGLETYELYKLSVAYIMAWQFKSVDNKQVKKNNSYACMFALFPGGMFWTCIGISTPGVPGYVQLVTGLLAQIGPPKVRLV